MSEPEKCLVCALIAGTDKEIAELRAIENPIESGYMMGFQHGMLTASNLGGHPMLCDRHGTELARFVAAAGGEILRRARELDERQQAKAPTPGAN